MLRICYSLEDSAEHWKLCGQLAGPWVQELRSCWEHSRLTAPASAAVIDLSEVTFIDESGERLLSEMRSRGAEFLATGVETRDLLANLAGKGAKTLRRLV